MKQNNKITKFFLETKNFFFNNNLRQSFKTPAEQMANMNTINYANNNIKSMRDLYNNNLQDSQARADLVNSIDVISDCISTIQKVSRKLHIILQNKENENIEITDLLKNLKNKDIYNIIKHPNKIMQLTIGDFINKYIWNYLVYGEVYMLYDYDLNSAYIIDNAYIVGAFSTTGYAFYKNKITILHPNFTQNQTNSNAQLQSINFDFDYNSGIYKSVNNRYYIYRAFDTEFDDTLTQYRNSKLTSLIKPIITLRDAYESILSTFKQAINGGLLMFNIDKNLTEAQITNLNNQIERLKGNMNSGSIATIINDLGMTSEWHNISSMQHMDNLLNTIKVMEEHICKGFGIPLPMKQNDSATYNNMQHSQLEFVENTILPLMESFLSNYHNFLKYRFPILEEYKFKIDESKINCVNERNANYLKSIQEFALIPEGLKYKILHFPIEELEKAGIDPNGVYKNGMILKVGDDTQQNNKSNKNKIEDEEDDKEEKKSFDELEKLAKIIYGFGKTDSE